MPQLDQFTYLTQFVWLCVFYCTLDVLLYHEGLPLMSRRLKLRSLVFSGVGCRFGWGDEDLLGRVLESVNTGVAFLKSSEARACLCLAGHHTPAGAWPRTNRTHGAFLAEIGSYLIIARGLPGITSGYGTPPIGAFCRRLLPADPRKKIHRLVARAVLLGPGNP
uniref:H(+)-transporting two-sector ATPase n=1 Tax=Selaginella nipponica TaxID=872861 RepID=A0A7U3TX42_9TRAC|nr:ATP synthase subunit 8 [Selaginella nipponica]